MAHDGRRFVIVPRDVLTDPAYAGIRADRALLGAWLMLYLEADMQWPVAPSLPRWLDDPSLDALASAGLVLRDGEERYRLAIVDASRAAAKAKAEGAAAARWNAPSNAPGNAQSNAWTDAQPMPTQTKTETDTKTTKKKNGLHRQSGRSAGANERPARRPTSVTGFTTPLGGPHDALSPSDA